MDNEIRSTGRKSSYCGDSAACTEVASDNGTVLVRDTKSQAGPVLRVTPAAWARFTRDVKAER